MENERNIIFSLENPLASMVVAPVVKHVAIPVVSLAVPVSIPVNHSKRPKKFSGLNFKRWQQKMLFYLTTLNLVRFLIENAHVLKNDE